MKRHKLDGARVAVLTRLSRTQGGRTVQGANYRVHEEQADFLLMDAQAGESKHSALTMSFYEHDDRGILPVSESIVSTYSKYDGERAWAGSGITRAELELHEEFHRGPLMGREETTFGELRTRMMETISARRENLMKNDDENDFSL